MKDKRSARMLSHVLSGVIFFGDTSGSQNPWTYSLIYNGSFLIPEMIISIIVLVLVWGSSKEGQYLKEMD